MGVVLKCTGQVYICCGRGALRQSYSRKLACVPILQAADTSCTRKCGRGIGRDRLDRLDTKM